MNRCARGFRTYSCFVAGLITTLALAAGCPSGPATPTTPKIGLSTVLLSFTATEGMGNPTNQTIQISNSGVGTLAWSATSSAAWLSVSPGTGTQVTDTGNLTVSVDAGGLTSVGSPYAATITISSPGADNSPATIAVSLIVNPLGVDCSTLATRIDTDTTLTAGCYIPDGSVQVTGATLTLEPGVIIIFRQSEEMTIAIDGRLSAVGTEALPIYLTGMEPIRGYWGGLRFSQSNSLTNRLDYVTIQYGGGWWRGNLLVDGTSSALSRVEITNCRFRESETYGFYFDLDSIVPVFSNNTLTSNTDGAGSVHAEVAGFLDDGSTYVGNDEDVVAIRGGTVTSDQTWPGIDADFLVDASVQVGAALTIAPGARLVFAAGEEMTVDVDGSLTAAGTEAAPIVFTGLEGIRGYWGGLRFYQSNSAANRLDYVTIEYAGGWWSGGLLLDGTSTTSSRVDITNCTLSWSENYGFYFDLDVIVGEFSGNTVTNNMLGAGSVVPNVVGFLDDTSTYTGNDLDAVFIRGGSVSMDQTWAGIDGEYRFSGSAGVSAALTIEPGARLVFEAGEEMTVNSDGSLVAVGTADQPIVLTGVNQIPGFWGGLRFYQSNSVLNRIDYVTIEYGGGWWIANLLLDGTSTTPTQINVTNSTFTDSGQWGIDVDVDVNVNGDLEDVNTFADNPSGNVRWP